MGTRCSSDADCDDLNPCNGTEACSGGTCVDGTPPAEGTTCDVDDDPATRDLCVDGRCARTRCGDGYLDPDNDERCDDGNAIEGDGCDSDCSFSCTEDADCDDGDECNGQERCSSETNRCEPGAMLPDGTDCADGAGSCLGGTCGPRSCTEDADCDDGDACTGMERCTDGRCAAGTPLDCDDGNACTADTCVPDTGCVNVLIDGDDDGQASAALGECGTDCDDARSDVHEGAPEICDGVDNDCDGTTDEEDRITWYADCDGDGFAAARAPSTYSCSPPPASMTGCAGGGGSWTTTPPVSGATDCNDGNSDVFPGQTAWFSNPIPGAPASVDYDYNCDGSEETERQLYEYLCHRRACYPLKVFGGSRLPACGEAGPVATRCVRSVGICVPIETGTAVQRCR